MKKSKNVWRYLFKLPVNTYNNDDPYYELKPLPCSDQKKVVIFAGKNDARPSDLGFVYVYLELSKELSAQNTFANLQRLLNLIYLETGLPTRYDAVQLNGAKDVKSVLKYFGSSKHNDSKSYSGTAPENN
ncbi:unnamed protein product, partial [marine sediment metagenome]